jgi:predicted nucleic acid-binding protein
LEYSSVLIDTSIIIDYLRKQNKEKTLFWKIINNSKCYISTITVFELYSGVKENKYIEALDMVLSHLEVLDFNAEQAKAASNIFRSLKAKNKLIEFRDIFIASCAIATDMPIATLNTKHFERIDGLVLL